MGAVSWSRGRGARRGQLFPAAASATPRQQRCKESGRRGRRGRGEGRRDGERGRKGGREILEGQAPLREKPARGERRGYAGSREQVLFLFPLSFWHKTGTVGDYLGNPKSGMTQ